MAAKRQPKKSVDDSPQNLLVELLVEELPPKALKSLGLAFATAITSGLADRSFLESNSETSSFATPRRLAVHISHVRNVAPDEENIERLLPTSIALSADGNPTDALRKKLAKSGRGPLADLWNGATRGPDGLLFTQDGPDKLFVKNDGKSDAFFLRTISKGGSLLVGLGSTLEEAIDKLPIPKVMSYQLADGWSTVKFVRPVHGLVALHGTKVVPVSILGLTAGNKTHGHRFEAKIATIKLKSADSYAQQLDKEGAVIASFELRRQKIAQQISEAAKTEKLKALEDETLLDEVTALVEQPKVLTCEFEKEFLEVPQECLILTMKSNQKYFPLLDAHNKLSNKFLVVSNIRPKNPRQIVEGNERVVRPRLADAKFFYDQDRKKPLLSHLEALGKVVYHHKLGSQLDRIFRIEALAEFVFGELPPTASATKQSVKEAAQLCKCDLLTLMVGEFPELQGTMGRYYALAEGKNSEVAESIYEHYLPRGAGDELPKTTTGISLAIADKIDAIVGVFMIGQKPTGAKDPFGVRRSALGVLRILIERRLDLDLVQAIQHSVDALFTALASKVEAGSVDSADKKLSTTKDIATEVYDYIMERLRSYYLEDNRQLKFTSEMFDAVLDRSPKSPLDFDRRLHALADFLTLPDAPSLAAANKRISNILRKSGQAPLAAVNSDLLRDPAEKMLSDHVAAAITITEPMFAAREYTQAMSQLARLRGSIDAFFDSVLVMADDEAVRNNRLALLAQLRRLFLRVADLSRLPG